ncbi:30S ribosomal protein S3 [Candidatus Uhrbacteria bacterium]|nr:30S ribosomal protein S3 [Candidatus Uhrbacteria bacterium]
MGQKVNPKLFRTGILFSWDSKWFARGPQYIAWLRQDVEIRKFLEQELKNAGVAKIEIERTSNAISIVIHSAKPGVIIGRQGVGIEDLKKKFVKKFFVSQAIIINLNVVEVDNPTLNSQLVLRGMIDEIEKRLPYRRVLRQALERVSRAGATGVKVMIGGRLNGAEIANREMLSWGKVPLHTLRANIDYASGTARTTAGAIGIKVWIYRGEIFNEKQKVKT